MSFKLKSVVMCRRRYEDVNAEKERLVEFSINWSCPTPDFLNFRNDHSFEVTGRKWKVGNESLSARSGLSPDQFILI